MPPTHTCTHMYTPTQEAFHFLTWKAPAVIGQSGHVQLHIPGERKVIGHLEPDAQPNTALCLPEQNQSLAGGWDTAAGTTSKFFHRPWPTSPLLPSRGFIFLKFKVEAEGDNAAGCVGLPCGSRSSLPTGQDALTRQVGGCLFAHSYNKQ